MKATKIFKRTLAPACFFLVATLSSTCFAKELLTNAAHFNNAPSWLTETRVYKVVDRVQALLEWDIHRVEVNWILTKEAFMKDHGLGPLVLAVSKRSENKIVLGPEVTDSNFNSVFGHELVHVVLFQKYKEAIPKWLEEGLANHLGKNAEVNYSWLKKQKVPKDVHDLTHPFRGDADQVRMHYQASQALIEMIAKKCDLRQLIQMSVGRGIEGYLETYCELSDLNKSFTNWLGSHQ